MAKAYFIQSATPGYEKVLVVLERDGVMYRKVIALKDMLRG